MSNEWITLLAFFCAGILVGLLFDIFRITRKSFNTPNIVTYIEDTLFWILSGLLVLYIIHVFTTGEIRLYMILMLMIGTTIYFLTISKYFMLINIKILSFIKNIIIKICKFFQKFLKK